MGQSQYRWVIVAAGGLLGCVAFGALFSLPVFLRPIAQATGWSITGVSTAMTIAFVAMAVGSIGWGSLSDRLGPRVVVFAGSILLAASLALASFTRSLLAFQLIFGLLVGGATAAIFAPMMACVTGWFETRRSLAVSLVSAGMGMAPMTMSPLAAWLVSHYDWRTALLIISALVAAIMIPVAFLVRSPPALASPGAVAIPDQDSGPEMSRGQALRSPQFIILLLTNFFCCATHSGPIFHTVSYAVTCGIPLIIAVSIYSVEGLAGLGGRVAFGLLGDRFGAKHVLVVGIARPGVRDSWLSCCARACDLLHRRGAVRIHLRRRHAPLFRHRARKFSAADDGDRDRRNGDGRRTRHGDRTGGRGPDLRFLRQLLVALHYFFRARNRRLPDRPDVQAVPKETTGARAGVTGLPMGNDDDFVERLDRGELADFDHAVRR